MEPHTKLNEAVSPADTDIHKSRRKETSNHTTNTPSIPQDVDRIPDKRPSQCYTESTTVETEDTCDEFSYKLYDQGMSLLSTTGTRSPPLDFHCPYHEMILFLPKDTPTPDNRPSLSKRDSIDPSWVPPLGLTDEYRIGTATSCGCTCALYMEEDCKDFTRDIEGIRKKPDLVVEKAVARPT